MFPDLLSRGRDMHQTHLIYLHKLDDLIQLGVFFFGKTHYEQQSLSQECFIK